MTPEAVHKDVARLSISTDLDRSQVVSIIQSEISKDPPSSSSSTSNDHQMLNHKRRRRRSSVQTTPTTKKKKKTKPLEFQIDPELINKKLSINEIRDLVLFIFNENPTNVKWLKLNNHLNIKKVVFLMIPGLSIDLFNIKENKKTFKPIALTDKVNENFPIFNDFFKYLIPLKSPGSKFKVYSTFHTFTNVPLSKSKRKQQQQSNKSIKLNDLLMNLPEMIENKYPIPSELRNKLNTSQLEKSIEIDNDESWVETRNFQHEGSKIFAMDCEMCLAGMKQVLTRVSLVNFEGDILLNEYVKPIETITDYVTKYSGITEDLLKNVTTTLEDVQEKLLTIISDDDILIGHSLESDLKVLKIKHKKIIDTALIFDHYAGKPFKPSLKWLSSKFLDKIIQNNINGHDSIEDSLTCLELVKLKLKNGFEFGKNVNNSIDIFTKINNKIIDKYNNSNTNDIEELKKSLHKSLVLNNKPGNPILASYSNPNELKIGDRIQCDDDDELIDLIINNINDYDLLMGTLRQAENYFGWNEKLNTPTNLTKTELFEKINQRIEKLSKSLPENSLIILTSSIGDPREMFRLQLEKKNFQKNFEGSKWDLKDEGKFLEAVDKARDSMIFIGLTKNKKLNDETVIED